MASKKDRIRRLFENSKIPGKEDIKYSGLLNEFIIPFQDDFSPDQGPEYILHFSINAWNMGNMRVFVPKKEFDRIITPKPGENIEINVELLKKMVAYKVSHYKEYDRFITEFRFSAGKDEGEQELVLRTLDKATYMLEKERDKESGLINDDGFKENYIDRHAIVLKPKQPFLDWVNSFISEDKVEKIKESNIYLVDDTIDDLEKWLEKNFDKLFRMELDEWYSKKYWPKNRTYKMFRQWFQADVTTMIYDLEKVPILKENIEPRDRG
ncbi:hypothetical protein [Sinomicrobium sp. M5D2P9]